MEVIIKNNHTMELIYKFEDFDNSKVKEAGGKNASLGEMFAELSSKGINIPDGFTSSAEAYWKFIKENDLEGPLKETLSSLKPNDPEKLKETGRNAESL